MKWIATKFGADIHGPQRINPHDTDFLMGFLSVRQQDSYPEHDRKYSFVGLQVFLNITCRVSSAIIMSVILWQLRVVSVRLKAQLGLCPLVLNSIKLTCLLDWRAIDSSYKNTVICSSHQLTHINSILTLLNPLIPTSSFMINRQTGLWHVFGKQWSQQLTVTQT